MRQDTVFSVESPGGQDFDFIVNTTKTGSVIFIHSEDPSNHAAQEQAVAGARLAVAMGTGVTRVRARLWDDETEKEDDATHVITHSEAGPDVQRRKEDNASSSLSQKREQGV